MSILYCTPAGWTPGGKGFAKAACAADSEYTVLVPSEAWSGLLSGRGTTCPYPQPPAGLVKDHIRVALTPQGVRYAVLAQLGTLEATPAFRLSAAGLEALHERLSSTVVAGGPGVRPEEEAWGAALLEAADRVFLSAAEARPCPAPRSPPRPSPAPASLPPLPLAPTHSPAALLVQVTNPPAAGAAGAIGQALEEQLDAIAVDSSVPLRDRRPTGGVRAVVAWLGEQLALLSGREAGLLRRQLGARVCGYLYLHFVPRVAAGPRPNHKH